ncbi:MAG: PQQ-binding-like beta-propeller repeat protein [Spirosomataceae bacterium]
MKHLLSPLIAICLLSCNEIPIDYTQWRTYGGTTDAARYSSLDEINVDNVQNLQVAWEFHSGDSTKRSQIQCQPIIIDGVLFATTPQIKLIALDAATGKQKWFFNPFELLGGENSWAGTNRGVTYWTDGKSDKRIIFTAGSFMMAINAETGKPVTSFGDGGKVDLHKDLTAEMQDFLIVSNTPGTIYKDLIIMGMRLSEGLDAAPGHVRAYDIRTGEQRWIFHTIPHPGEFGYETWGGNSWKNIGGANNWAGMTVDENKGIVYVPTGSATYDFWGGYRPGDNLFANSLVALNAETGERIWHYQTIHHDVWDRDLPTNPNLITIQKDGNKVEAVAQITKQGFVFVFDRKTGNPIFEINEVNVPQSTLDDEITSKTQPVPTLPQPFMRQTFTKKDITDISPEHNKEISAFLIEKNAKIGSMWMVPDDKQPHVMFPGFDGGGEWGGAAFDPETNLLYVNANEMPWLIETVLNHKYENAGQTIYANNCANCHGLDRKGNGGAFPNLTALKGKYDYNQVYNLITNGKGAMPAFKHIPENDRKLLVNFLLDIKTEINADKIELSSESTNKTPKYLMKGYKRLLTKDGYPGIKPPWGTLNAIDMNTGKIVWKSVLGEYKELTERGIAPTGTENYGGPAVTAGGLVFIAATKDEKIRAFDKKTGKVLWQADLPAAGHATPAVYAINGKQFIVIACGGGKGTKSGDAYVAFALP